MIAVDTNVLARLFVTDNKQQHEASVRFFADRSGDDPAFVSLVVQAELVWLLAQMMKFSYERVRTVLEGMLSSGDFVVEQPDILEKALEVMAARKIDLADFLIAGVARRSGCATIVTFDRDAAKYVPGMELLK